MRLTALGVVIACQLFAWLSDAKDSKSDQCQLFALYPGMSVPQFSKNGDCQLFLADLDFDQDGVIDWRWVSRSNGISQYVPADDDLDNDGIANLFDADVYQPDRDQARSAIPQHLLLKNSRLHSLQQRLYQTWGILALEATDRHNRTSLTSLLEVAQGLAIDWTQDPRKRLLVYAFKGHGIFSSTQGMYHPELHAISMVGSLYLRLSGKTASDLRSDIAHEMGHAIAFRFLKPHQLGELAHRLAGWPAPPAGLSSFDDPCLHAARSHKQQPQLVSQYASTNIHEWFGEMIAFSVKQARSEWGGDSKARPLADLTWAGTAVQKYRTH